MKMEQTECPETSEHNIHTPGNHPKNRIQQFVIYVVHLLVNVFSSIRHEMNTIRSVLKVLRKILGLKMDGATEHWIRLQNEVICTAHRK